VRTTLRLARWLGPWSAPSRAPDDVVRDELAVSGLPALEAWVYRPRGRELVGSVLLVPGLHFLGPRDPRFDRFARVLAHAGHLVFAPFLPTLLRLEVTPAVLDEVDRALDALLAHPLRPRGRAPGLMSISFGSMPALRLAARRGEDLANVLIFGGFADFRRALRFALRGEGDRPNDPLNAPAVVINLLPFLDADDGVASDADRERLRERLLAYCARTWGRPEMKVDRAYVPHAEAVAADLDEPLRKLFLQACRVTPGIEARIERALERSGRHFDWIDPRPELASIRRPVTLVHGVTDDVIPFEESRALLEALAPHTDVTLHLTGLYGHTHVEGVGHGPRALAGELVAMGRILGAMASLSVRAAPYQRRT
jgi:pimeloyl-ACP methyl ester carboxylesterase